MNEPSMSVVCGFLGGTILSVEGGYRVLQHPRPDRVFRRIADARWFLAVQWCDRYPAPAAILTHDGQLSFYNGAVLDLGEAQFLPPDQRQAVFTAGLEGHLGQVVVYPPASIPRAPQQFEVFSFEIDPRYGQVVMVCAVETG